MLLIKSLLAILLYFYVFNPVMAEIDSELSSNTVTVNKTRLDIEQSAEVIKTIMSMEEFQTSEKIMDWRIDFDLEDEEDDDDTNKLWAKVLLKLAHGVEYLLWLSPILLLMFIIYYRKYWIRYLRKSDREKQTHIPDVLLGVEISPDTLPNDVAQSALQLWQHGDERQALSLLFRASLIKIFLERKVNLASGLTERECIDVVKSTVADDLSSYFEMITNCWVKMAYGHVKPEQDVFKQLCLQWGGYFDKGVSK